MNEKQRMNQESQGVNLQRAVAAMIHKMWLIVLSAVLCAAITFTGTYFLITPKYESAALFYVNNNSFSLGDASLSIDSGDISASKSLVNSYIVILNTRESIDEVIAYAGVDRTYGEIKDMISAASVNGTEIFEVVVTSPDPREAEQIANAIAQVLPSRIAGIIEGTSAKIVDHAVVAASPSSPNYTVNMIVGFLIGCVLAVGIILMQEMFDIMIRSDEDIAEVCEHPVLATVPDLTTGSKGVYEYTYGRDDTKTKKNNTSQKTALFGKDISFSAAEAYKLLRTKLQFSFSDDSNCRVIGVSSSLSGEGKSLTSINLAYTLSQLNKKVILIDCDMRRPTLAEKLGVNKKPGLSSYLTAQGKLTDLIQNCGFAKEEKVFHVITAGQNPPNPVELLSSARMQKMLEIMKKAYDYVILDLPPVVEVSDAMAVAKQTDGILLVVRQNACDRNALFDTVCQFEFIDAKILGVVFNCVNEPGGKGYYKKYYKGHYRKYGKRYYRGYYRRFVDDQPVVNDALDMIIEE